MSCALCSLSVAQTYWAVQTADQELEHVRSDAVDQGFCAVSYASMHTHAHTQDIHPCIHTDMLYIIHVHTSMHTRYACMHTTSIARTSRHLITPCTYCISMFLHECVSSVIGCIACYIMCVCACVCSMCVCAWMYVYAIHVTHLLHTHTHTHTHTHNTHTM